MERKQEPSKAGPAPPEADAAATMAVPPADPAAVASYPYRPGDLVLPGYRLVKRLGQGGFGEVWRATAPGGMGVAIKVLANLGRREGGREYRALGTVKDIRHPHIVPIFGVWLKSGDGHVLEDSEIADVERQLLHGADVDPARTEAATAVLKAVDADLTGHELVIAMGLGDQTLHDRLRQSPGHAAAGETNQAGGLPRESLLVWMRQAALAIDHFNRGGHPGGGSRGAVQHCDIKPQNILLVGDAVQVCDFGLARLQGEVRATNTNMASLAYAAPELLQPPHDPSPSTDQYALAISYHELRTGRLPFADVRPVALLRAKLEGSFAFDGVPAAEAAVLARATSREPTERFPTCTAFVEALERCEWLAGPRDPAASLPVAGALESPQSVPGRSGLRGRGARAAVLALGACLLLAGGATAWLVGPRGERGERPAHASGAPAAGPVATREQAGKEAVRLERNGAFAAAGEAYARALADEPDRLAATLWDLQTQAADGGRHGECVPLLMRLEALYRAEPPPSVQGITRWDVVNTLAWYLVTVEPVGADAAGRARLLADEALAIAGSDATARAQSLDTLAAVFARDGQQDEAVRRIDEAIGLAADPAERAAFDRHREAFAAGRPWSEP